ncbi:hypothetical protein CRG98_027897 [Punica granatum]|uniref:Secreted protein n=1 Tax=Punica granatum TaxID=22663 RepID=A0A2I0J676_PUNGR|nr:hypothetical protein CRG98_027897 [Punica granatum]
MTRNAKTAGLYLLLSLVSHSCNRYELGDPLPLTKSLLAAPTKESTWRGGKQTPFDKAPETALRASCWYATPLPCWVSISMIIKRIIWRTDGAWGSVWSGVTEAVREGRGGSPPLPLPAVSFIVCFEAGNRVGSS